MPHVGFAGFGMIAREEKFAGLLALDQAHALASTDAWRDGKVLIAEPVGSRRRAIEISAFQSGSSTWSGFWEG